MMSKQFVTILLIYLLCGFKATSDCLKESNGDLVFSGDCEKAKETLLLASENLKIEFDGTKGELFAKGTLRIGSQCDKPLVLSVGPDSKNLDIDGIPFKLPVTATYSSGKVTFKPSIGNQKAECDVSFSSVEEGKTINFEISFNKLTSSYFTLTISNAKIYESLPGKTGLALFIAGSVVSSVLVLASVVFGIVFCIRRCRKNKASKQDAKLALKKNAALDVAQAPKEKSEETSKLKTEEAKEKTEEASKLKTEEASKLKTEEAKEKIEETQDLEAIKPKEPEVNSKEPEAKAKPKQKSLDSDEQMERPKKKQKKREVVSPTLEIRIKEPSQEEITFVSDRESKKCIEPTPMAKIPVLPSHFSHNKKLETRVDMLEKTGKSASSTEGATLATTETKETKDLKTEDMIDVSTLRPFPGKVEPYEQFFKNTGFHEAGGLIQLSEPERRCHLYFHHCAISNYDGARAVHRLVKLANDTELDTFRVYIKKVSELAKDVYTYQYFEESKTSELPWSFKSLRSIGMLHPDQLKMAVRLDPPTPKQRNAIKKGFCDLKEKYVKEMVITNQPKQVKAPEVKIIRTVRKLVEMCDRLESSNVAGK